MIIMLQRNMMLANDVSSASGHLRFLGLPAARGFLSGRFRPNLVNFYSVGTQRHERNFWPNSIRTYLGSQS